MQKPEFLHFRQVLMGEVKVFRPAAYLLPVCRGGFVIGNHLPAAAAVSGDGIGNYRIVRGYEPLRNQRMQAGAESGCITSRNADSPGTFYFGPLVRIKFRNPINPPFCRPMRRTCIDNTHRGIFNQRRRLTRRSIGQTKKNDVASFRNRCFSAASFLFSDGISKTFMSSRAASRSWILSPVVP